MVGSDAPGENFGNLTALDCLKTPSCARAKGHPCGQKMHPRGQSNIPLKIYPLSLIIIITVVSEKNLQTDYIQLNE